MNILESYNKLFTKFDKFYNDGDNESAHMIQDEIYLKFIRDIKNKKK